ncbi:Hercynine oxygenase [Porphyromonas levii]|uniref:SUMF1/EgtB/PvdO family nonheme iron enzyme n=1 Tax=Porphyromonas levii TaxID=28114 RepID=UPI0020136888|nr:SUMF1/EgtB/PvdO family nonheme iron enzyme [Porphyromonas levii]MBR8764237.1 Hercynine oxygenase [Porphyromonas levii]
MNRIALYTFIPLYFFLMLLAGCQAKERRAECPEESGEVVFYATIGDDQNSSRAKLSPNSDQMSFTTRWQEGDEVHLYIKQFGKTYDLGLSKLTDLTDDGAQAVFRMKIPEGVSPESDLEFVGISGRYSFMKDGQVVINVSHHNRTLPEVRPLLYFQHRGPLHQELNVRFKHLGMYEVVHITNSSSGTIELSGAMLQSSKLWYYAQPNQPVVYITEQGKLASAPTGEQATIDREAALQRASVSIPAGGEGVMVNSYALPLGEQVEAKNVSLVAQIGGKKQQTTLFNSSSALINGCAYHIYATWDGAQLLFRGEEFPLVISTSSIQVKKGETATLSITSGNGAYECSMANSNIAKVAKVEGNTIYIEGLSLGETTLTIKDKVTQEEAKAKVTVYEQAMPSVDIEWIEVPSGSFMMGSPEGEGWDDERPQHKVSLSAFRISKYEVTFDQYDAFCEATGREKPSDYGWGRGSRPVIGVSWHDAKAFCNWLGNGTRLPTEAEWEYACRAGSTTKYSFGDEINSSDANYGETVGKTTPVGSYPANAWGIHDMHGNVWEWCEDWYSDTYYSRSPRVDPKGDPSGSSRVYRGGSWCNGADYCRSAHRYSNNCFPGHRAYDRGFRVVSPSLTISDAEGKLPLILSTDNIRIVKGTTTLLGITSGNGAYECSMANSNIAKVAKVEGNTIYIEGLSLGETTLTIKDKVTQEEAKAKVTVYEHSVGIEWIEVPSGSFMMGSPEGEGRDDEKPQHKVSLSAFRISKYEVTFDQYDAFCEATGREKPSDSRWHRGSYPVINVSWHDAKAFCNWLGNGTRLPTEAEWEYACRAGSTTKYSFGDEINRSDANYRYSKGMTTPVGSYPANAWGIHDMHGNVSEWCEDWYSNTYYNYSPKVDPKGDPSGRSRVLRGGDWCDGANNCRSAYRSSSSPDGRYGSLGFRVVSPSLTFLPLILSTDNIRIVKGTTTLLGITSGNGAYECSMANSNIAKVAKVEWNTIYIEGLSLGETVLSIKDKVTQKEAKAKVTVYEQAMPSVGIEWIEVPSGSFMMGSPEGEGRWIERPQHKVSLSAFRISKYEVTFDQYDAFCEATGREKPSDEGWGRGSRPVINVSWNDAKAFCNWLGNGTRLPTEAEWEYACRAGSTTRYSFGDEINSREANFWITVWKTTPVGSYPANAWGIHDMHGNVWEWCEDRYRNTYYSYSPKVDPKCDDPSFLYRVYRGGSWYDDADYCRSAYRNSNYPGLRSEYLGFRVVSPSL